MGDSSRVRKPVFRPFQTCELFQLREPNGLGRISVIEQVSPGVSNFKNLRKSCVFSPPPSILVDGEGWGGVALSFRDVRWFADCAGCLRIPLSIILSPRFAGGARRLEVLGWWMRLKKDVAFEGRNYFKPEQRNSKSQSVSIWAQTHWKNLTRPLRVWFRFFRRVFAPAFCRILTLSISLFRFKCFVI